MTAKQWVWIYRKIKKIFEGQAGSVPDDATAAAAMDLNEQLQELVDQSTKISGEGKAQISKIMEYVFLIIHSLEQEEEAI